ncbi:hypothetical protein ACFONG_06090 [Uliginosibacterium paludis]|uniref:Uncharacterized protein n=1 Tax=Uliginosibacterium paludis TaxID=1615952 RepID=A0ABV2CLN1_9RHOO
MSTGEYRVVFRGGILAGFEPETVRQKASRRLKASEEQIVKLFSGRMAILRKGVEAEVAERYVRELRAIGMDVASESMSPPAAPAVPDLVAAGNPRPVQTADLEKTQLADPNALAAYLNDSMMPLHGDAPDSLIGRRSAAQPSVPAKAAVEQDAVRTLVASAEALDRYVNAAAEFTPPPVTPAATSPVREEPSLVEMAPPAARETQAVPEQAPVLSSPFSHMTEARLEETPQAPLESGLAARALARRKKLYFGAGALIVLILVLWLI